MNMNNRLRTTLNEMDIRIHTVDVSHEADEVTYHENYLKQILSTIFFYSGAEWRSGKGVGFRTKGSLVRFPAGAHFVVTLSKSHLPSA